jgi:hypothetical protein
MIDWRLVYRRNFLRVDGFVEIPIVMRSPSILISVNVPQAKPTWRVAGNITQRYLLPGVGFTENKKTPVPIGTRSELELDDLNDYQIRFYPNSWIRRLELFLWTPTDPIKGKKMTVYTITSSTIDPTPSTTPVTAPATIGIAASKVLNTNLVRKGFTIANLSKKDPIYLGFANTVSAGAGWFAVVAPNTVYEWSLQTIPTSEIWAISTAANVGSIVTEFNP